MNGLRVEQSRKALLPMLVTVLGISKLPSLRQPRKASFPMEVNPDLTPRVSRLVQPLNVPSLIQVTPEGIVKFVSSLQFSKA